MKNFINELMQYKGFKDLSNIQTTLDAIPDVVPIDSETIKEIVEENSLVE